MEKLRIIKFWCIAFVVIIWNTLKGNHWHMIYVDFQLGEWGNKTIRKQLIAKRTVKGFNIYWQDLSGHFLKDSETTPYAGSFK